MMGIKGLLSRYSVGPKWLIAPGPDEGQLRLMVAAALPAPDQGQLLPCRFKVIRTDAATSHRADLFAAAARRVGKDEAGCAMDAQRAVLPPLTVAGGDSHRPGPSPGAGA